MDSSVRQSEKFHFFLYYFVYAFVSIRCTVGVFLVVVVLFFFITTYCISVCSRALICTQCVRAHKNAALSRHESGGSGGAVVALDVQKEKKTEKSKGQQRKAICLLHLRAKNVLFFVSFFCLKRKKETLKKVT